MRKIRSTIVGAFIGLTVAALFCAAALSYWPDSSIYEAAGIGAAGLILGQAIDDWYVGANEFYLMPKVPPKKVLDKMNEYRNDPQAALKQYTVVRVWLKYYL